ncbi:MAG: acyl carrier protein [Clostridia bacterium]|nr:acyl carrier protein [Clostridia bacterium]
MDDLTEIKSILDTLKPGTVISGGADLIKSRVLDSFTIVRLVAALEDEFDVEITPVDITEENFRSADAIKAMIDRLRDE